MPTSAAGDLTRNREAVTQLARRLDDSEQTRVQLRQFSLDFPDLTIAHAYDIQRAWVGLKCARGRTILGHKIGLTSKAMQYSSNISEPDYGTLLDDMFYNNGADLPMTRFIRPRLEVELGFVLRRGLRGPGCTLKDVLEATDDVVPAVEIIDARIMQVDPATGITRKVTDTIADNAASAALVVGDRRCKPENADLRWVSALCIRNDEIEESGVAAAVLNHPATGVAWLANKLQPYGEELKEGEFVLGGSFTRPVPARAGDAFHVDYGTYGSIRCQFV